MRTAGDWLLEGGATTGRSASRRSAPALAVTCTTSSGCVKPDRKLASAPEDRCGLGALGSARWTPLWCRVDTKGAAVHSSPSASGSGERDDEVVSGEAARTCVWPPKKRVEGECTGGSVSGEHDSTSVTRVSGEPEDCCRICMCASPNTGAYWCGGRKSEWVEER